MAVIQPLRAIRYAVQPGGDLSELIAPPYDVLSQADKHALLARNPHNIVAVDLPHTPPKSLGPAEGYQRSADLLSRWLADGILLRDGQAAVYAYQQTFQGAAGRQTRRGFIALVRAEPLGASATGIFPHEQTFGGPKEDRLALTRATRCQLSPIFGLFADEVGTITASLYDGLADRPDMRGRLGEVSHEAWRIADADKIEFLRASMARRAVFIADGHHRYATALEYRAELENKGPLPPEHPARLVMFVCVSMSDPGLAIWPTHRVLTLPRFDLKRLFGGELKGAADVAAHFDIVPSRSTVEELAGQVAAKGPGWLGVKHSEGAEGWLLRLTDPTVMDGLSPGRSRAYRGLDVAILHRYFIDEVLKPLVGEPLAVEYPHTAGDVAAALASRQAAAADTFAMARPAAESFKLAFLLAPTPLQAIRDVCLAGELMPQKSTFFYPKLATGLTLYSLH